ncbi:DUF7282 domain-containing protein [Halorussus caseinilyticus]|uniref:DUF7282 domain-containing protein n=1 Tax=Halorussus caseinilyticus TaxID=3034025 RepID=A0ABD5WER5_9EURY|nr:hypothetical protein [Halorussus sp. DT72]
MSRKHASLAILLATATIFGGVATTFAATGTDAGPVQSPPSEVVRETQATNTSVTLENQTSGGTVVTISQVSLSEGGFVVVHDRSLLNGSVLDSVRGSSEYLEAGSHENVEVTLDQPIEESQRLLALAYRDTNGNQSFDFVETQGQDDGAYTVDNQVVVDEAFVTVEEVTETTTTETTTETTTTETPTETTTTTETTTETPTETTTTTETTTETPTETTTTTETTTETPTETTTTTETTTETPTETTTTTETTTETPTETTTTTETTTETPTETTTTTETTTETPTETTTTIETPTETTTTIETPTETTTEATTIETTTETETTTTEEPTETTTIETTTETTTTTMAEQPVEERRISFRIDNANVEGFSFIVGSADEPDRTVVVENVTISDRTVRVDLTKLLSGASLEESLGEAAADGEVSRSELQTVEFVFRDVTIQNVEFVVTAPKGVETRLPERTTTPTETTTEESTETTTEVLTETTATPTETETTTEELTETETTTETTTAAEPSLRVPALDAPQTVVLNGSQLVVGAEVSNPSDRTVTETVQLRIDGTVVAQQTVKAEPGETRQVQFELGKSDLGLEPGQAFLGVLTDDFGETVIITVEDRRQDSDTTTAEG